MQSPNQLIEAVTGGNADEVRKLLDAGLGTTADRQKALMLAAQDGSSDIVRVLLRAGVDPENPEADALPIVAAASNGHAPVVVELLDAGASPDPGGDGGALSAAALNGHTEILLALLEAGAEINVSDSTGWTPLMWAAYGGEAGTVEAALDGGADTAPMATAGDFEGATALELARSLGHADVVSQLEGR